MIDKVAEWGFPVGKFELKLMVKDMLTKKGNYNQKKFICVEYALCPGGPRLEHVLKLLNSTKLICKSFFVNQLIQPRHFFSLVHKIHSLSSLRNVNA